MYQNKYASIMGFFLNQFLTIRCEDFIKVKLFWDTKPVCISNSYMVVSAQWQMQQSSDWVNVTEC